MVAEGLMLESGADDNEEMYLTPSICLERQIVNERIVTHMKGISCGGNYGSYNSTCNA